MLLKSKSTVDSLKQNIKCRNMIQDSKSQVVEFKNIWAKTRARSKTSVRRKTRRQVVLKYESQEVESRLGPFFYTVSCAAFLAQMLSEIF